jgi:hypothetical protein
MVKKKIPDLIMVKKHPDIYHGQKGMTWRKNLPSYGKKAS